MTVGQITMQSRTEYKHHKSKVLNLNSHLTLPASITGFLYLDSVVSADDDGTALDVASRISKIKSNFTPFSKT